MACFKAVRGRQGNYGKYPVDLPEVLDRSYESDIINQKYDFISEIIEEVLLHKERQDVFTEAVDRVLTSKIWGIPVFLVIMAGVFFLTFTVGDWIKGYFEMGIDWLSGIAESGLLGADTGPILTSLAYSHSVQRVSGWTGCPAV